MMRITSTEHLPTADAAAHGVLVQQVSSPAGPHGDRVGDRVILVLAAQEPGQAPAAAAPAIAARGQRGPRSEQVADLAAARPAG